MRLHPGLVAGAVALCIVSGTRVEAATSLSQPTYTQLAPPGTAAEPAEVDLTTEGTLDWAHWGRQAGFPTGQDRKKNVNIIGNASATVTQGRLDRFDAYRIKFKWSDGDPNQNQAGTQEGLYIHGDLSRYKFTVTTPQAGTYRLRVYVSAYHDGAGETVGRIRFDLTDGARSRTQQSTLLRAVLGRNSGYYETTYTTDNANATLDVILTEVSNIDTTSANLGLLAATLWRQEDSPEPPPCSAPAPTVMPADRLSWFSEPGRMYQVQRASYMDTSRWFDVGGPVAGNGDLVAVCQPGPGGWLYRVLCLPERSECVSVVPEAADRITWSSEPGRTYQAQWTSPYYMGTWFDFGGPVAGTGAMIEVCEPVPGDGSRMYRVVCVPE